MICTPKAFERPQRFQAKVKVQFFLDPAIQCFYNCVICRSFPFRHRAKYIIMFVSLAEGLWGTGRTLVGAEDYLGVCSSPSFLFVAVFAGFGANSGFFVAFMRQIVREYPACFLKHIVCEYMMAVQRMFFLIVSTPISLLSHNEKVDYMVFFHVVYLYLTTSSVDCIHCLSFLTQI